MPLPLPPSLLTRLRSDETSLASALASGSDSASLSSARSLASRRLLLLTPKALDAVESVLDTADPKNRLAAATLVLSKSPATSTDLAPGTQSLPDAVLKTLSSALLSLASAFNTSLQTVQASPAPLQPQSVDIVDVEPLPEEPHVTSEPLPILNLPDPDPSSEMTSSGMKTRPSSSPSPKKPASKKSPSKPKSSSKAKSSPARSARGSRSR